MADIELKSFPFDSMDVLNEQSGQMEPDREYLAEVFRNYFAKFLSNGVYFGNYKNYGENSMKVVSDIGLNIKVLKGAGIIEGADYENEDDRIITLERPANGSRVDRVVVQFNASLDTRATKLIIKQGEGTTPAELTRTENIFEICIAEVTVKSTSNITDEDIIDKRLDTDVCGIVDSLISIDGEELYQRFQAYINSVIDNIAPKSHASATSDYGLASKDNYGHCKIVESLEETNYKDGEVLGARMGKALSDTIKEYASEIDMKLENYFPNSGGTIEGDVTVNGNEVIEENLYVDHGGIRSQETYSNNTVTGSPNLYITSSGNIRRSTNTSSKRYKEEIKNVENIELNPEKLYKLPIRQFKYKKGYFDNKDDYRYNKELIGFIAEEVAECYPIAADYEIDKKGNKYIENWNERYMIPAMLYLIQKQHNEIEELKRIVKEG